MMTLPDLSLDEAMRLAALVASVGIVWDAVELTLGRAQILEEFFQWRVVRSRYYILLRHPTLAATFDTFLSGRVFASLVVVHAVAAVVYGFVLPASPLAAAGLAGVVLTVHLGIHVRLLVGLDGADQMQTIVWTGLFVYALDLGEIASVGAAAFICAQLLLSYLVSGGAKLLSPTWRRGAAIARITRAATYCPPRLSRALQTPALSFAVCWAVIAFEVAGPVALVGGRAGVTAFVVMGAALHLGIAMSMGLSTFAFAFLAAYPVLYSSVT